LTPISASFAPASSRSRVTALRFLSRKRIRLRANVCAQNWKRFCRACVGAFTSRS
jgi:hypothetical protein